LPGPPPIPAARWEGVAEIPGAPMRMIVDIARDPQRKWVGSVILPGLGVKGAPLNDLTVTDAALHFGLTSAFSTPLEPAPAVRLARRTDGTLAGELHEGGHAARLLLRRTGRRKWTLLPKYRRQCGARRQMGRPLRNLEAIRVM